ncbi:ABC transporter ATP-binding protein [Leifsonia sp. McL0607]|uniref:ABC transporter ATP-binding protein n=1 Tax=Leifsonia sp. McL0607 TaxID=3415672 RepID=UPI003CF2E0D5
MIEVHALSKSFGAKRAVDDVSFAVRPGMVTGFLGPNGAGKSTIMKMILGLERPTSGSAEIGGMPYAKLAAPMSEVGALIDASWVHPGRSARSHLRSVGLTQGHGRRRVEEVLDLTGLTQSASKRVGTFSLGMKQRLGLATALLGDPGVLILDEPVNGLDPDGVIWIRTFLRELAAEGRTVLLSSHLMSEMEQTADRIIVIGRGRLIADETLGELVGGRNERAVVVRSSQLSVLVDALRRDGASVTAEGDDAARVAGWTTDAVGEVASAANVTLHELRSIEASLEDAYRRIVADDVVHAAGARTESKG